MPDLTTTVLTLTVTGIGADSALGGGKGSKSGQRRSVSVVAMFVGALVGAVLILHVHVALPLVVAAALVVGVAIVGHVAGRSGPGLDAGRRLNSSGGRPAPRVTGHALRLPSSRGSNRPKR